MALGTNGEITHKIYFMIVKLNRMLTMSHNNNENCDDKYDNNALLLLHDTHTTTLGGVNRHLLILSVCFSAIFANTHTNIRDSSLKPTIDSLNAIRMINLESKNKLLKCSTASIQFVAQTV